ncbi:MAG: alpha/beta hydrolase [Candidatus Binatia bacterium]|nr:alpha/beta hydrolase [Candidatus Binatia bacterium]MDG2009486.1 alpha/beta hydrolase [Candidatus Binatia bacterium]
MLRNLLKWALPALLIIGTQNLAHGAYDEALWEVTRTNGVTYGQGATGGGSNVFDLQLDIYEPEGNPDQNKPVMVFVHGGGFTGGNREGMSWLSSAFASRGYLAVSITYRLKWQNPPADPNYVFYYPDIAKAVHASAVDAKRAIRWLRANADTLGINTDRIFIGGTSAGGFISLHAGITDDEDYFTDLPGQTPLAINNPNETAKVHGILNFCGGAMLTGFDPDDPPVFMAHTVGDGTVPVVLPDLVEEQLIANDIPYEYYRLANGGHCGFFNQTIDSLGFVDLLVRFMNTQVWDVEPEPRMVPATKLQLKDDARTPPNLRRRKLTFLVKTSPQNLVPPVAPLALSESDPTVNGARLEIYRPDGTLDDHFVIELPAAGWTAIGPDAARGYRYKAPQGGTEADVRVRLKNGFLKIVGKGAGMPSLENAPLGAVSLRFLLGAATQYCASTIAGREDSVRQYRAEPQNIGAFACPERPVGFASPAFIDAPRRLGN